MIKINMLSDLDKALIKARLEIYNRSFSGRHPELGKMINCPICDRRHRGEICQPRYYLDSEGQPFMADQETNKGVLGAAQFKGKRKKSHHSHRLLQLVQRTQQLYFENEPYFTSAKECRDISREDAVRQLKKERSLWSKFLRRVRDVSRRVNAGLAKPGSRYLAPVPANITDKARSKRRERQLKIEASKKE